MKKYFIYILAIFLSLSPGYLFSQNEFVQSALKALGAPNNPKVQVSWNRFYDYKELTDILKKLNKAYPDLTKLESIGKTFEGRDIWCITITNSKNGKESDKPGYFIDAAIHANEIQGVEVALYTAWYLLENYVQNAFIKNLLDTKTFFIIPVQNIDSREAFLHSPLELRTGRVPRDDDGDGLIDEDGPEDLNGDGYISDMRIKIKGGRYKADKDDPRMMVRCKADEEGEYDLLGEEGIDNDGDGLVNEDGPGSYDANRNWGWIWRPNYIQYGADRYPFSLPETKAVADFMKKHSNILASESYHNSGGMFLVGPDQNVEDIVFPRDIQLLDFIGKKGTEMIPDYRYINSYKGFYPTYGDETNWHYANLGILSFTNELWTPMNMFRKKTEREESEKEQYKFDKLLLFNESFIDWKEYDHPQYGKIEIGGFKKQVGRIPPSFLLEEECHRNMAFTLFNAEMLPSVSIDEIKRKPLGKDLFEISVVVRNCRPIPTKLDVDVQNKLTRPDLIILKGAKVISGGIKLQRLSEEFVEQKINPETISVPRIEGNSSIFLTWIVKGKSPVTVEVDSEKGGRVSKQLK
jgi:hypothetical protein